MLKEIGITRIFKYLFFGLWDVVFRLLPWSPLRVFWMKLFGADVSWSAVIDRVNLINLDRNGLSGLKVGDKAFLGCAAIIDLAGKIILENHATVSPGAVVLTHLSVGFSDHPLIAKYPKKVDKTIIGNGSFIGVYSVILSGVTVGKRSLVAAGSVVTKDIPDDTMVAGVPAVVKKKTNKLTNLPAR